MARPIEHFSNKDALETFQAALEEAAKAEQWMAAVWKVEPDGRITLVRRTTWNFPSTSFSVAVAVLKEVCDRELESSGILAPLPRARLRTGE